MPHPRVLGQALELRKRMKLDWASTFAAWRLLSMLDRRDRASHRR